ncbi:lytic transglycosylase domain-containing protein [Nonomuraea sp. NPDC050556]|uniref:aggregation-promoting factor C-terminal-like domain-containing protein n=1 Tax=Nonomuraea sp. NPDC050556 TaxID=3364369 RepID=UPI0037B633B7
MDSKRALAIVIAATAFTGGGTVTVARADDESTRAVHQRTWESDARPEVVVRKGTWDTQARPKVRVHRPKGRNKEIALGLVVRRSWSFHQFRCLDSLWTRESNWNHRAYNRSSGAYGIPQALPGGKMAGAGWDWRHNPTTQIRWGLTYIKSRYGRPCGAWGHFRSHNWY